MQITLSEGAARFNEALERLGARNDRILLAVSGGPDSLAMLLLAHAVLPDRIVAATVDHGLRPEARAEADFVAKLCDEQGIPHHILTHDQPITGNIQSSARTVRYDLLHRVADQYDCTFIATAHHADDQLETLLMRLARGSGVDGMSGVRARNGKIIRPLLEFSKSELEEICQAQGIQPVRDPSNDNGEFDRVAVRQWLAEAPELFKASRANQTASAMHDAGKALAWMAEQLAVARIIHINDEIQCDAAGLPAEMQRRLVLIALSMIDPELRPRGDTLMRTVEKLSSGKTSTVGNILCKGGSVWSFSHSPPRRSG